jgi:phasin family protein
MTMTTQTPSDTADLLKRLDSVAMTEQYKAFLGKFKLPNLDTTALVEIQSRNVQALTDAKRAILESTQSLFQHQNEMVKQVLEEASRAVKSLAGSASPHEAAEKEVKLIKDSVGKALANFSEISGLVSKTQDETMKVVTDRLNESLTELRASISQAEARSQISNTSRPWRW